MHIYFNRIVIYFLILVSITSCKCNPDKNSHPNNPKINLSTDTSYNPTFLKSTPPNPPLPPSNKSIHNAIHALEETISKPATDPALKNIYEGIKLLPPREFIQVSDGRLNRINKEKNGRELFTKAITYLNNNITEIIQWLLGQGLLEVNEENEVGTLPLEEIILQSNKNIQNAGRLEKPIDFLVKQGAKLPIPIASKLLKGVIENNFITKEPNEYDEKILELLQKQGATLSPEKSTILLKKLLNGYYSSINTSFNLKPRDYTQLDKSIKLLKSYGANAESQLVNQLLQTILQSGSKDDEAIKILLDLGANPNITISDNKGLEIPLIHYLYKKHYGYNLLEKLIQNPSTDINAVNPIDGCTIAMEATYNPTASTGTIEALLENPNLDINTIRAANKLGVETFTLLDMIIDNCIVLPTGHGWQQEQVLNHNKRWLQLLEKLKNHSKFFVHEANILRLENRIKLNLESNFSINPTQKATHKIAQEVLQLVKDNKK